MTPNSRPAAAPGRNGFSHYAASGASPAALPDVSTTGLRGRLARLANDIRVSIIGAGAMGRGLLYQCGITPGIRCDAIADIDLQRAVDCAEQLEYDYRIVESRGAMHAAIEEGLLAVCEDGLLTAQCGPADVVIESTNAIAEGGRFSVAALEYGKHLVMMNAEADLIFGPYLMQQAQAQGVTYTSCDGDQHGVIKRLYDEMQLWGFEPVMAGNIKGYLDRDANPTSIIPEADKRNLDYEMCTAYTDGTKLSIEMALVANALGLQTTVPGMQGPRAAHVQDVLDLFDLSALHQNHDTAVVDYILGGQPGGGVFAIGYGDHPYQRDMMNYYKMGEGPFYVFYRPYHLCHVEAMRCVAEAYLDDHALLKPERGFQTNVYAYAKKDLRAGDTLDGVGGYACYGQIENCAAEASGPGVPICLADGVRLERDVPRDGKILLEDVTWPSSRPDVRLYEKARQADSASSLTPVVCEDAAPLEREPHWVL